MYVCMICMSDVCILLLYGGTCVSLQVHRDETDGSLESLHACNSALAHPDNLN